jgi:hypothetical protein
MAWRWGDDAAEWWIGGTIAFRAEIEQILLPFVDDGLPPLTAVLCVLGACREEWPRIRDWLPVPDDIRQGLDAVHSLPKAARESASQRRTLVQLIFDRYPGDLTGRPARSAIRLLSAPLSLPPPTHSDKWAQDAFAALREGLPRVSKSALELRERTGLDALPEPAAVNLLTAEPIQRLLLEIADDPELGGLARMVRNLAAIVHLPRDLAEPEDLPLGGFSDVANRGPLDRLLLSELAHDDDLLMTRIALNEALYLRRETPPRKPPETRRILIDVGIRTWGVPRLFGTAVAMALASTADSGGVQVFRPHRDTLVPSDLGTRAGLIEHLQALESSAHPGRVLEAFFGESDGGSEPVLITVPEALADAEFRRSLADCGAPPFYAACVEREGRVRLISRSARGQKLLQEAHLDIDKLLEPTPRRTAPLIDTRRDPNLPIIFGMRPFPLRLTTPGDRSRFFRVDENAMYTVSASGMLLHWDSPQHGARLIAEGLPSARIAWHDVFPHVRAPRVRVLLGNKGSTRVWLLDIDPRTGDCTTVPMQTSPCREVGILDPSGSVFVISDRARLVQVFDPQTGLLQASCTVPSELTWTRGRYFISQPPGTAAWHALTFDGSQLRFEQVVPAETQRRLKFMEVVDRPGSEGPIGITLQGDIFAADGRTLLFEFTRDHPVRSWAAARLTDISTDRSRLVFAPLGVQPNASLYAVDLATKQSWECAASRNAITAPELPGGAGRTVRSQFQHIGVDEEGHLVLIAKGMPLRIELLQVGHSANLQLCQRMPAPTTKLRTLHMKPFRPILHAPYRLREALWDDGSRAVLDGRGLLHLRSSDSQIPETTIVLQENRLAGWCAGAGTWGDPYFLHPREYGLDVAWVWKAVLQPFARLLR